MDELFEIDNLSVNEENAGIAVEVILGEKMDDIFLENSDSHKDLPILPLKDSLLFPGMVLPVTIIREQSQKLIADVNAGNKILGVVAQRDYRVEKPTFDDIYKVGTIAKIVRVLKLPNDVLTVVLQGKSRFCIEKQNTTEPYMKADTIALSDWKIDKENKEIAVIYDAVRDLAIRLIDEDNRNSREIIAAIKNVESPRFGLAIIITNVPIPVKDRQELLEEQDFRVQMEKLIAIMNTELQRIIIRKEIQNKTRNEIDKMQREHFLKEEIRYINEALGNDNSSETEIQNLKDKAEHKKWTESQREHFEKELKRLQRVNPMSPDYSVIFNYLELYTDLPWGKISKDVFDLKKAQKILDKDHFGMEEVKRRIIEYLAVLKLRNDMKSPILCLYGPPGVGKTSLGKSIAASLGRKYVRMSLGGVHDESEIRGHRKTYVGAMPGRVLQLLKKAGTSNPVMVLDEIDKLGQGGFNGSPASALLEVLDPEQNNDFHDNFLEIGYDLSKIMFVATANDLSSIPAPLRDRMEIINISGYTIEEKVEIAKKHLLPKQLQEHGMKVNDLVLGKKELEQIIEGYTRESGVRNLEKQIAKVVRFIAKSVAMEEAYDPKISSEEIKKILGIPRFERDKYENNEVAGVVTGLAWTSTGGDILFIESILSKGKGSLSITGNLGKVMRESATIALEYIKANAEKWNINERIFEDYNIHIHVPEGATPKDGPSAGITMLTSFVSLLTQRSVKKNIAMTGEITLRGKVLPVGGIKEKILAAKRAGIKEIILCKENEKDISEIKADYLKGLIFHYVTEMKEVIDIALTNKRVNNYKELIFKEVEK